MLLAEAEGVTHLNLSEQQIWEAFPAFVESNFLSFFKKDFLRWAVFFMDDQAIARINEATMQHHGATDVITLTLSPHPWIVETYVGVARMRQNAHEWNTSADEELLRLLFHSLLHGLGYEDRTEAERKAMRRMEDEWIERFRRWYKKQ